MTTQEWHGVDDVRVDAADGAWLRRRVVQRVAATGLCCVLVALAGVSFGAAVLTDRAGRDAAHAAEVSDLYQQAGLALSSLETRRHEVMLEQHPSRQADFLRGRREFGTALERVAARDAEHGQVIAELRRQAVAYDIATAPVLLGAAGLTRSDDRLLDASVEGLVDLLHDVVEEHRSEARQANAALRRTQRLSVQAVVVVFVVGVALLTVSASVLRAYRRSAEETARRSAHDALHDTLTGLPNRRLLADRFAQALRGRDGDGTGVGLLLIDLDRFKEVNDTFGHHYGDALLAQVGPRLRDALRDVDTVARLGGDEFAVVLPGVRTVADVMAIAGKLQGVLSAPFHVQGVDLDVEGSIGVVLSGEHGDDASTLLQRADIAMYVAKSQNLGVFTYDPATDSHSPARLALLGDLRRGLERRELVVHYQPKVSIRTGDVVGAEALLRWQHPERGLLFPDTFIPLAEHTGLIRPLTQQVLSMALAQARTWLEAGQPLAVSVNLSARNLLDERLPGQVAELLDRHGVPAGLLELEVTESAIMTEPARAQRLLEALRDLGVLLSIDDFGAGYTSLGQLKALPVTEIKVDRSFVMTLVEDTSNALIVRSVVDLGHNLGLRVVAEGVESAEALSALAGFGCDVAQGYHLSRPVPVPAFDTWRAARSTGAAAVVPAARTAIGTAGSPA